MDRNLSVSFTVGTLLTIIAVGAATYALWVLRDLALLVLTAIVIASAIEPGVAFFARRGIPRILSVVLMYGLGLGSVFILLYFFFPPILDDAQGFLVSIPHYLDTVQLPDSFSSVAGASHLFSVGGAQSMLDTLFAYRSALSGASSGAFQLFAAFFGGAFSTLLVIVLSFYFALQETGVEDFLRVVTPSAQEEYVVNLWFRAKRKIGLWMQGQILLSIIVGVLIYLGLLIMGVPYALLLAVFTAMAEIIPIFGSLVAGVLAAVIAFADGGAALGFIVAGLYVIVNQFEANLIYPLVVKKVIGLPPLLVILALIAGATLAGFLGVLLSVPVAAALQELFADFDRGKRSRSS